MKVAAVIPVGDGRRTNLECVLASLRLQSRPVDVLVVVSDGADVIGADLDLRAFGFDTATSLVVLAPKHEPGMEQPRNVGARVAEYVWGVSHVWFLDSDVMVDVDALEQLERALVEGPQDRILVAPYDWLDPGRRPVEESSGEVPANWHQYRNDPRWEMFDASPPGRVYRDDLSAALACWSGNLMWPVERFKEVGGFWNELYHGRCEDGELGLRAAAMGVGISFAAAARGWHLWHPRNEALAIERNKRDVPMLNARHPWVQEAGVILSHRDGAAFDVRCRCGEVVATGAWWAHAAGCTAAMGFEIPFAS